MEKARRTTRGERRGDPGRIPPGSVLERIGDTPLLELRNISAEVAPVRICAKAEWFNPGGSIKDRPALSMILDGERSGRLTPDKIILDATSGNTGIGLALVGSSLGYRVQLILPGNVSEYHRQVLRAYGARLLFTPAELGSDGAIAEARRLYEATPDRYFYADQYRNPANWRAHYEGTGAEIIRQTGGRVTHFVCGLGSSGTFMGVGRRLREYRGDIKLISVQPSSAQHDVKGLKHMPTSIIPGIYSDDLADQNLWVSTGEAYAMVGRLAREEGLLVGPSAGAAVAAALRMAGTMKTGLVATVLPDSAHKYLSLAAWKKVV